jgi:hypothetical protein
LLRFFAICRSADLPKYRNAEMPKCRDGWHVSFQDNPEFEIYPSEASRRNVNPDLQFFSPPDFSKHDNFVVIVIVQGDDQFSDSFPRNERCIV